MSVSAAERWSGLSPITRTLIVVTIAHLAFNALLAFVFHQPTVFEQTAAFFQRYIYGLDSWKPMGDAYWYLKQQGAGDKPLYEAIFFERQIKFQYPLTSLLVYEPIAMLSKDPAFPARLLSACSWGAFLVTPLALWRVLTLATSAYAPAMKASSKFEAGAQLALVAALTWTFYPLAKAYHLGQIQAWLNLGFALLVIFWIENRQRISGVLLAGICLMKPQMGVLLIWGALRKRWSFVIAAVIVGALGGLAALALYGFENNIGYLNVLSYLSAHGESYHANQSVNGILNRWVYPADTIAFHLNSFPAENAFVRYGTLLTTLGFLGAALFARRGAGRGDAVDIAAAALLCTIASPIAWEHHYGVAAVGFVLALPAILASKSRARLAALAFAYLTVGSFLPFMNAFAETPLNILQTYLFFGAVMLAVLLLRLEPFGAAATAETKAAAPA